LALTNGAGHGELHHFSKDEMNILCIDVSGVGDRFDFWASIIERWLNQNQIHRIGAILIFIREMTMTKVQYHQRYRVIRNKYAFKPIPEELLMRFAKLDN
jgi:hypothetical protein